MFECQALHALGEQYVVLEDRHYVLFYTTKSHASFQLYCKRFKLVVLMASKFDLCLLLYVSYVIRLVGWLKHCNVSHCIQPSRKQPDVIVPPS